MSAPTVPARLEPEYPVPTSRVPLTHPGKMIRHDFLEPYRMSVYRFAKGMRITQTHAHQLLRGERSITPSVALRLSRFLGCSPEFWTGLQADYDLDRAREKLGTELDEIQKYEHQGPVYLDGEPVEWTPTEIPEDEERH